MVTELIMYISQWTTERMTTCRFAVYSGSNFRILSQEWECLLCIIDVIYKMLSDRRIMLYG